MLCINTDIKAQNKKNIKKNLKRKSYLSLKILLFMVLTVPIFSPLVVNAQEPIEDFKENINIQENIIKEAKALSPENLAKNVAYGENNSGKIDNGVGTIDIDAATISDFEYKINAMTHEVIVRLNIDTDIKTDDFTFAMNVKDASGNIVTIDETNDDTDPSDGYIKDLTTGPSGTLDLEIATGSLEAQGFDKEGKYNIYFTNTKTSDSSIIDIVEVLNKGDKVDGVNIEVPKTLDYTGQVYSLIGDNINAPTDTDNISDKDKVEPSGTLGYGIYELESIGAEEANAFDWTANDLTLAKYDHVIRPLDGNYLVANNIDATPTDESSTMVLDKDGGWSSDTDADGIVDTNDGYRPIGQVIGTSNGEDSLTFTGQITGNVDEICGATSCTDSSGTPVDSSGIENTYIKNMYISMAVNNIGMIAIGNDAQINNLGIVDPSIDGKSYIGSFAGQMLGSGTTGGDTSKLLNVYAVESEDDGGSVEYDIVGSESQVGGIVGYAKNTNIYSDSRFEGDIQGIDLSSDVQPNEIYPDKDGYKTFNTLDVKSAGYVGGIVGELEDADMTKVYNKGEIRGGTQVGGVVGALVPATQDMKVNSMYNYGVIYGTGATGGVVGNVGNVPHLAYIENAYNAGNVVANVELAPPGADGYNGIGGITGFINNSKITNVFNSGDITGEDMVGGVAGNTTDNTYSNLEVKNAYNTGTVIAENYDADTEGFHRAGGIMGDGSLNGTLNIENVLNSGDVTSAGTDPKYTAGALLPPGRIYTQTLTNGYNAESALIDGATLPISTDVEFPINVSASVLNDSNWWKGLAVDSGDYDGDGDITETWGLGLDNNFNISAGDAIPTTSPSDSTTCVSDGNDESCDNDVGQVERGYYPTVKEVKIDGTVSDEEVPEQSNINMPKIKYDIAVNNYKINGQTLDIYLLMTVSEAVRAAVSGDINIYEGDYTGGVSLPSSANYPLTYNIDVGDNMVTIPGSPTGYNMKPNQDYTISVLDPEGIEVERLVIHTPNIDLGDGKLSTTEDNYMLIGDGVNQNTFISSIIMTDTTEANPTKTSDIYGVYELESIGYEDKILEDGSEKLNDWSKNSFTLYKYDHVIRPIDGNYKMAGDIDASATRESELVLKLDKEGGWSTDSDGDGKADTNDGFIPIGATIKGTDLCTLDLEKYECEEQYKFSGKFIGDSKVIKNMYIDIADITSNVGIFANNAGEIDGVTLENDDNSKYYVHGKLSSKYIDGSNITDDNKDSEGYFYLIRRYSVGGLVGVNEETGIISNVQTSLSVMGQTTYYDANEMPTYSDLSPEIQAGIYYFTIADLVSVGGIAGTNKGLIQKSQVNNGINVEGKISIQPYNGTIDPTVTVPERGDLVAEIYQGKGGVAGVNEGVIDECINKADLEVNEDTKYGGFYYTLESGVLGGIAGINRGDISNAYSSGNITTEVSSYGSRILGGIAGVNNSNIINSHTSGNVESTRDIGGIAGYNKLDSNYPDITPKIANCYSTGNVLGSYSASGITYSNGGEIINSYSTGNVVVKFDGASGISNNATSGKIINSYSTGDISADSGRVGGISDVNKGEIINSYSTGKISGHSTVGGIVAENMGGSISNSYTISDIEYTGTGPDPRTGAIVGYNAVVDSFYSPGTITNSYAYERQTITAINDPADTSDDVNIPLDNTTLVGDDPTNSTFTPYIATYDNLIDAGWYSNPTVGSGLGWSSDGVHTGSNLNNGGSSNLDWTSPWTYGEDTVGDGVIDDTSKEYCMPHVMNDIGEDGDVTNNDGSYVPEQPCVEIEDLSIPIKISNYKINAQNLDIILRYDFDGVVVLDELGLTLDDFNISMKEKGFLKSIPVTCEPINDLPTQTLTFEGSTCSTLPDTDYEFDISIGDKFDGTKVNVDFNAIIHTPKYVVQDYDLNLDGVISEDEKDLNFMPIGDGDRESLSLNENTFVESSTGFTDTSKSKPIDGVNDDNIYGIYEMESIGYEEANAVGSKSKQQADWSENDLTLTKYDHIIRPLDGYYTLQSDIDASVTNEEGAMVLDKDGGWSSDSDSDGTVDENDGYQSIGRIIGQVCTPKSSYPIQDSKNCMNFSGVFNGQNNEINNLYIQNNIKAGLSKDYYTGLFALSDGLIEGLGIGENSYIKGNFMTGAIAGYNGGNILNSYTKGNVEFDAPNYDFEGGGAFVGGNTGKIENSYATGDIRGGFYPSGFVFENWGEIINSYATGDVYAAAGGSGFAYISEGSIKNSYATGNVTITGNAINFYYPSGSFVGDHQRGELSNNFATGNVTCVSLSYCGAFAGDASNADIGYNSLLKNNYIYENQKQIVTQGTSDTSDDIIYTPEEHSYILGVNVPLGADTVMENNGTFSLEDATNPDKYTNPVPGEGLGWASDDVHTGSDLNSGGNSGLDWTTPWMYGEDTDDDGIIDDTSKEYCMPHVMADVGAVGDTSDNDGSYVPDQPCVEIKEPVLKERETHISDAAKEVKIEEKIEDTEDSAIDAVGSVNVSQHQKSEDIKTNILSNSEELEKDIFDEEYYPSITL